MDLQLLAYIAHGQIKIFEVKIAPSKFGVMESAMNKEFKNRQRMSLMDIIGLLCVSLNIHRQEFKTLCAFNTLFLQLDALEHLSIELIQKSYDNDTADVEIEGSSATWTLDLSMILIKLKGNVASLVNEVFELKASCKITNVDDTIYKLVLGGKQIETLIDGLSVVPAAHDTDVMKQITGNLSKILADFFHGESELRFKQRIFKAIEDKPIFAEIISEREIKKAVEREAQGQSVLKLLDENYDNVEIYKRLGDLPAYPKYKLVQLLSHKRIRADPELFNAAYAALTNDFDAGTFKLLKSYLSAGKKDLEKTEIQQLVRFYNETKTVASLKESSEVQSLLEPFRTELIKTNIFDEFNKQKEVQTGSKFTNIKNHKKTSSEEWRKLVRVYVIDDNNVLKLMLLYDHVDANLGEVVTAFLDNKVNFIGTTTNLLMFYFSYFEYVTYEDKRVYLSSDSFACNVDKLRIMLEMIIGVFYRLMQAYTEPINENLHTLEVLVKLYFYTHNPKIYPNQSPQTTDQRRKLVGLIFRSFSLDYIWYKLFKMFRRGTRLDLCLGLIVDGFAIMSSEQLQETAGYILKKRSVNDKLITYNYTKEIDHYLKIVNYDSVFKLLFDLITKQTEGWMQENSQLVAGFYKKLLTFPQLEIYDVVYEFTTKELTNLVEIKPEANSINGKDLKKLIFMLELVSSMVNVSYLKSYMLSRKFTTVVLGIDKALDEILKTDGNADLNRARVLLWNIISALCDPSNGLRKHISGSKSEKLYVEDIPIETHLIEIFGRIFPSLVIDDYTTVGGQAEVIIVVKLDVLRKVLSNSQGKNVFQQYCTMNKGCNFLGAMIERYNDIPLNIKLKLIDLLYNFKRVKDFKNMYLLDKLVNPAGGKSVQDSLEALEQLVNNTNVDLERLDIKEPDKYAVAVRKIELNDFASYINENRQKILRNEYKTPKLSFNNEMPEDIKTRFAAFKASVAYDKDFKSEAKASVEAYDLKRLSNEIEKRRRTDYDMVATFSVYVKGFKFAHTALIFELHEANLTVVIKARAARPASEGLLPLKSIDQRPGTIASPKIGMVVSQNGALKKKQEEKAISLETEKIREAEGQPSQLGNLAPNRDNSLLSFINPANLPKIPLPSAQESGGNLLLQNLAPMNNTNKQIAGKRPQGAEMPNMNMSFMPPMMQSMPQFGYAPQPMMPPQQLNQFQQFMPPMMPGFHPNYGIPQKMPAEMLHKRPQQDFYQSPGANTFVSTPSPQHFQHGSHPSTNMQMPYNARPSNNRSRHPQGGRDSRKAQISPELDRYEFSDEETTKKKADQLTPPRKEAEEETENSTMQFLKKLRRTRN